MTPTEIKYVEKLIEYIEFLESHTTPHEGFVKELEELGKQCQFKMLCDPDIFEASANEHFKQENKYGEKCIHCGKEINPKYDPCCSWDCWNEEIL